MKDTILARIRRLQEDFDASFIRELEETGREELVPHLTVRVGNESLAIPIHRIRRLVRGMEVVPLPGASAHLLGIINLRGDLIAVYDLPSLYGYPPVTATGGDVVVLKGDDFEAGIAVSGVDGLTDLDTGNRESVPESLPAGLKQMIHGTAYQDDRLLLLPDLDALFVQMDARR